MMHGIYKIQNIITQDCYIGSAANNSGGFSHRFNVHLRQLNNNKHHSIVFQRAWNKYGANAFKFEILLYCDPKNCLFYEQIALDYFKPKYNICMIAGSRLGTKLSKKSKNKIRISKEKYKGKNHPWYGRKHSEKSIQKMRNAKTGKVLTESHKNKIRNKSIGKLNHFYGKKHSQEAKEKIGLANSKLNNNNIEYIKFLIFIGRTGVSIAKLFNVSEATISKIKGSMDG